ncbi:AraC family transcriptional regulator [Coraliomargarita sp. SDUM461004]|uniref:AraC family transcriptional regulator n=1 Tax=Thalassobacterium sedimentorum TaxID=3041258 RepID=A0ABU1ADX5_9BACT|nr:AraC family transcriptional regulator [Coraliomargarita sp. SDUM461004]MDQ8192941.1 AraC family transcriptional regulator [Coraliomargarita sp. SDUM461004]
MRQLSDFHAQIPLRINEPENLYSGLCASDRVLVDNVLMFQRLTRSALSQNLLGNRMHHRYVLTYVIEGAGRVLLDGTAIALKEGDALLVAPYQYHDYRETDVEQLRWLFITFEVLKGGGFLSGLRDRLLRLDEVSRDLLLALVDIWQNKSSEHVRGAEILPTLERLLLRLRCGGQVSRASSLSSGEPVDEWVSQVEELILKSVYEDWSLEEVARRANVSLRYLRSRFEKVLGVAPSEYRANYQLHTAMLLMRDSRLSLSQVAERSGFSSLPVFSRFVKRRSGLAPSQLRQSLLKGAFEFSFSSSNHDLSM